MSWLSSAVSHVTTSVKKTVKKVSKNPLVDALGNRAGFNGYKKFISQGQQDLNTAIAFKSGDIRGAASSYLNKKSQPLNIPQAAAAAGKSKTGNTGFLSNLQGFFQNMTRQTSNKNSSATQKIVASPMQGNASLPNVVNSVYDVYQRFRQIVKGDFSGSQVKQEKTDKKISSTLSSSGGPGLLMILGVLVLVLILYKVLKK